MYLNTYSVKLICRIASTPEIKTYDNGQKQRCVFDASVNMGKDSDGKYIDRFVTLTFWGKDAEYIARYPKGHRIIVEGTEDYFVPTDRNTGAPKVVIDQNGREKIQVKPQVSVSSWLSLDPLNTSNNNGGNNQGYNQQNGGNGNYQQNGSYRQGGYGNQQGGYPPQAAPPANAPQQRNAAAPPTASQTPQYAPQANNQTQFQVQGGLPYDNGMEYTDDGDLPF